MNNIDTIMYLIDWRRSKADQHQGIAMARNIKCIQAFFQPSGPGYSKSVWGNCAKIICERPDEELIPYTLEMLMWLQDINWPGALDIMERLLRFSEVTVLAMTINEMLPALIAVDEISWLMGMANLLSNKKLVEALSENTIHILNQYSTG